MVSLSDHNIGAYVATMNMTHAHPSTGSGRAIVTYILKVLPNFVREERRILLTRCHGNERSISNSDLIEHFPGQIPALILRDSWMLPERR